MRKILHLPWHYLELFSLLWGFFSKNSAMQNKTLMMFSGKSWKLHFDVMRKFKQGVQAFIRIRKTNLSIQFAILGLLLLGVLIWLQDYQIYRQAPNQSALSDILTVQQPDASHVALYLILDHDASALQMHYVEHLAWLNSIAGRDRQAGGHSNAWTTDLAVGYWLSGKPGDLPDLLRTLSGVFDSINLPRDFAEEERSIIRREYDLRMSDDPNAQAGVQMNAFLYQGNAISACPIGTPEEIAALDFDEARALHAATHRPENATFVVIGDVTERQVQQALEAAGLAGENRQAQQTTPATFVLSAPETRVFTPDEPDAAPRMIWRKVVMLEQPVDFDLLDFQTVLLGDILDANLPGGLAGPLRFDAFVTRRFSVSVSPLDARHIELQFSAIPDRGVTFAEMRSAFEAALSVSAQGIPPETWQRMRDRFKTYWPDWDDDKDVGKWMANYVLARARALRTPLGENELRGLDARLLREDLNRLLRALDSSGRTAIAYIGKDQK